MERLITWEEIRQRLEKLPKGKYYGVPRGGEIIAQLLPSEFRATSLDNATHILDDLIDSGHTKKEWVEKTGLPFIVLFNKQTETELEGQWLSFPWEIETHREGEQHMARVIEMFDDINRDGLQETPKRYIKFLKEFMDSPKVNYTTFEKEQYDQMIMVKDITFYSLCEHHLAPFFGVAHVAYLPGEKIVGISKLARCVESFARKFQNQERITEQVAEELMKQIGAKGVAVVLEARHMCMEMRGVRKPGAKTITSCLRGAFKDEETLKNEFFKLVPCVQ